MMQIAWGTFGRWSSKRLKAAWLITAGVIAIYLGAVEPMTRVAGGISSSRATGLAATAEWQPSAMWHPMRPTRLLLQKDYIGGFVGGEPGLASSRSAYMRASLADASTALPHPQTAADDRKTVVTNSFNLIVKTRRNPRKRFARLQTMKAVFWSAQKIMGRRRTQVGR